MLSSIVLGALSIAASSVLVDERISKMEATPMDQLIEDITDLKDIANAYEIRLNDLDATDSSLNEMVAIFNTASEGSTVDIFNVLFNYILDNCELCSQSVVSENLTSLANVLSDENLSVGLTNFITQFNLYKDASNAFDASGVEVTNIKDSIVTMNENVLSNTSQLTSLQAELDQAVLDIAAVEESISLSNSGDIEKLELELTQLNSFKTETAASIVIINTEIASLELSVKSLEDSLVEIETSNSNLESELQSIQDVTSSLRSDINLINSSGMITADNIDAAIESFDFSSTDIFASLNTSLSSVVSSIELLSTKTANDKSELLSTIAQINAISVENSNAITAANSSLGELLANVAQMSDIEAITQQLVQSKIDYDLILLDLSSIEARLDDLEPTSSFISPTEPWNGEGVFGKVMRLANGTVGLLDNAVTSNYAYIAPGGVEDNNITHSYNVTASYRCSAGGDDGYYNKLVTTTKQRRYMGKRFRTAGARQIQNAETAQSDLTFTTGDHLVLPLTSVAHSYIVHAESEILDSLNTCVIDVEVNEVAAGTGRYLGLFGNNPSSTQCGTIDSQTIGGAAHVVTIGKSPKIGISIIRLATNVSLIEFTYPNIELKVNGVLKSFDAASSSYKFRFGIQATGRVFSASEVIGFKPITR